MGEHGRHGAAKPEPRIEHRSRATRVERDRSRRWGPLTAETAIVLGVAAAIVAGAYAMESVRPTNERTTTTVGKDTIEVHQLGKGGIKPGALQPRVVVAPKPTAASSAVPIAAATATAKPAKTPKPTAAPTPTATTAPGSGGILNPPPGEENEATCTPIPLIKSCPEPGPEPEDPRAGDPPTAEAPPANTPPEPAAAQPERSASNTSKTEDQVKPAAKKKKKPSPEPEAE